MRADDSDGADVLITGGTVVPCGGADALRADVLIRNGRVTALGTDLDAPDSAGLSRIDARGRLVLPGLIDPHVHFNDPGFTDREDFYHGTAAAASGGITCVIDMPCTSIPPVTDGAALQQKHSAIAGQALIDYGLYGGVCAETFASGSVESAMEQLAPWVLGFKTYFISIMERFHQLDHFQFHRVLQVAKRLDRPVLLHAEDLTYSNGATAEAQARSAARADQEHSAAANVLDFVASRPEEAEILAIGAAVELARREAAQLHIVHVSTARGVELITGNPYVTGETCPHYLAFDAADFARIGSAAKVTPPIKAEPNRTELWRALADGRLSFVATDHAPAPPGAKQTGSIWTDYAGIPGCPTMLPFLLTEACERRGFSYGRLVEITSTATARRFGIADRKGALLPGFDGDCVVVDPNERWVVRGADFLSKGKITPFEGFRCTGRVKHTVVRGREVYRDSAGHVAARKTTAGGLPGIVAEPGWGRLVTRPVHEGDAAGGAR